MYSQCPSDIGGAACCSGNFLKSGSIFFCAHFSELHDRLSTLLLNFKESEFHTTIHTLKRCWHAKKEAIFAATAHWISILRLFLFCPHMTTCGIKQKCMTTLIINKSYQSRLFACKFYNMHISKLLCMETSTGSQSKFIEDCSCLF